MSVKNEVRLIGRLTKEFVGFKKELTGGVLLIGQVPIAVDRPKNKNGECITDFIKLKFIGNRWTGLTSYLKKGTLVAVVGQLQTGQYEDKDGNVHYTVDVLVEALELISSKNKED